MTQTTSPDNIPSPDLSDQYALTQDMANLADGVQLALIKRANSYTGTSAQRVAFTTAPVGTMWQDTNGARLLWRRGPSGWGVLFASGRLTSLSLPAGTATTFAVSFPGAFSEAPTVSVSLDGPVAWSPQPAFRAQNITTTGFTLQGFSPAARPDAIVVWTAFSQ